MASVAAPIAPAAPAAPPATSLRRIALLGNPNTGKTTLFNQLCGLRAKTSNYPGTTTAIRRGTVVNDHQRREYIDLPGLYDLQTRTPESEVVLKALRDPAGSPDVVIVVIDACNLTRNLVLCGELLVLGLPIVVALNMMDMAESRGLVIPMLCCSPDFSHPDAAFRQRASCELPHLLGLAPPSFCDRT